VSGRWAAATRRVQRQSVCGPEKAEAPCQHEYAFLRPRAPRATALTYAPDDVLPRRHLNEGAGVGRPQREAARALEGHQPARLHHPHVHVAERLVAVPASSARGEGQGEPRPPGQCGGGARSRLCVLRSAALRAGVAGCGHTGTGGRWASGPGKADQRWCLRSSGRHGAARSGDGIGGRCSPSAV
jgi:hypothetical protein